jgi:hypothetical protein
MRNIAGYLLFRTLGGSRAYTEAISPRWLRLDTHSSNDLYVIVYSSYLLQTNFVVIRKIRF